MRLREGVRINLEGSNAWNLFIGYGLAAALVNRLGDRLSSNWVRLPHDALSSVANLF